jgi:transcriptional regulator with XRE-family HTH domain
MRKPTGCIEHNPTFQSVKFCGSYINLSEISRTCGITQSALSRIFSCERKPSLTSAISISKALEMGLEAFLAGLEKHTRSTTTKALVVGASKGATTVSDSASRSRREDDQVIQGLGKVTDYGKLTSTPQGKQLVETAKNSKLNWWDRGQAVDELCGRHEMEQLAVANLTGLSEEAVGKQRICFLNLQGMAREMCRSGKMNADASCSLAHAVNRNAGLNQESVMRRAVAISKERDSKRVKQKTGLKGRQTFKGQITRKDMAEALNDEKYKFIRN